MGGVVKYHSMSLNLVGATPKIFANREGARSMDWALTYEDVLAHRAMTRFRQKNSRNLHTYQLKSQGTPCRYNES